MASDRDLVAMGSLYKVIQYYMISYDDLEVDLWWPYKVKMAKKGKDGC